MTMYATINNGNFNMTLDDVISFVWEFPFFTDPDIVGIIDSNGIEYTGKDLCTMAGIRILSKEEL